MASDEHAADPLLLYFTQVRAPARAAKYRVRTAQLRRWVQRRSPAAGFIDFDSLSLAPNGPPNTKSDKCVTRLSGAAQSNSTALQLKTTKQWIATCLET